jgi:membrane protease subunit HflK
MFSIRCSLFNVFRFPTMNDHPHSHDDHDHSHGAPETPMDAGSQALAEALHSSFAIVKIVMAALFVIFLCSGFFKVESNEQAIILRFGKPVGEGKKALLGSGLHWSFPYPIDEYVKVRVTEIQQVRSTVGWYATTPEQELAGTELPAPPGTPMNPAVDGYALTADGNIIHTRATLHYQIDDPIQYVFDFVSASNVVQNALNNALLFTAARFKVDDILVNDIPGFRDAVRKRAADLIEQEKIGISVGQCDVQSIPPRQLKPAFDAVVTAGQNRSKVLNDARSYENQVSSKASADAESRVNLAQSDRARLVNETASQAQRFSESLPNYQANPNLFVQQRLNETLGRVLTNVQDKIFLPERADGKSRELRLLLNREPVTPKPAANP